MLKEHHATIRWYGDATCLNLDSINWVVWFMAIRAQSHPIARRVWGYPQPMLIGE